MLTATTAIAEKVAATTQKTEALPKRRRSTKPKSKKVTIVLPDDLLERLAAVIPARQRSKFVSDAIALQLERSELLAVLDETAGAWSDKNHPDLNSPVDAENWLRKFRNQWTTRSDEKNEG